MKNKRNTFDIIISGGGLSGSLMALSLADLKKADGSLLSIAIVEATKPTATERGEQETTPTESAQCNAVNKESRVSGKDNSTSSLFDARVLALSHGSASYLKKMGVWQHLSSDACAIEKIDISDKGYYGKARIEAQEHGVLALGYVIEMALIGQAQLKELASKNNIHWFTPDSIVDIHWQGSTLNSDELKASTEQVAVVLGSEQILHANLLLACDGVNSPCRKLAGIKTNHSDYQQVALITNVATKNSHQHKAFERFTKSGPIAMLPLAKLSSQSRIDVSGDSRCSLVWTMLPEQREEILALSDHDFKQTLEREFGSWLGEITHVGKRNVFPLVLLQAEQQTYHRMALIGNASHTIHPIAGQGFNLGLRDVQQMRELIEKSLQEQKDIGRFASLNEYAQKRQQDQKQVIQLTDSLVTLFSNDLMPLVAGRNVGLKVMNYFSPIKNTLVNKLMGY